MLTLTIDGSLVWQQGNPMYPLETLRGTAALNKAGTLTFTAPPGLPLSYGTPYRSIVQLADGARVLFRGRVLYGTADFNGSWTFTCEGERGFFKDSYSRPYLYQDSPANIFASVVRDFATSQSTSPGKSFALGVIDVTDPNDYIRLESKSAASYGDLLDKLVSRCGGYMWFSSQPGSGARLLNWTTESGTQATQEVRFGVNLLDLTQSTETPEFATVLLPYGAEREDGTRVDIKTVNAGRDYIDDTTAIARYGRVTTTHVWDDVTVPANLLAKARQYLSGISAPRHTVTVTALDLADLGQKADPLLLGASVRVRSEPHGLDAYFRLEEKSTDYLNPENSKIKLSGIRETGGARP